MPPAPGNPLELVAALQIAAAFQLVLFVLDVVTRWFGSGGLLGLALLLGLTDVDALTASTTARVDAGLDPALAAMAIGAGILSNTIAKLGIAGIIGRGRFRFWTVAVLAAMAAAGVLSLAASGRAGAVLSDGALDAAGVHLMTRLDLARQAAKHRAPDESRGRTDDAEVSPELLPGALVGRLNTHFELQVSGALGARRELKRPGDLDVAGLLECHERRGIADVHERDVTPPDLPDRADDDFAGRVVHENLEPWLCARRTQVVQAHERRRRSPAASSPRSAG